MSVHEIEIADDPSRSLELLSRRASSWGAHWRPDGKRAGHLELPVLAGLRRGWVEGPVTVARSKAGSRLTFRVERSVYRLETLSVVILATAGAGALVFLIAPFVPAMRPMMPVGFILTIAAWLFIVARLRNSGPDEFFEWLAEEAGGEPPDPGNDSGAQLVEVGERGESSAR